jgi:hypothetical protein
MSRRRRILAASILPVAVLICFAILRLEARAENEAGRRRTVIALRDLERFLHDVAATKSGLPLSRPCDLDPTAQLGLFDELARRPALPGHSTAVEAALMISGIVVIDGWGRGFKYRSPGPVHASGWDVYSAGENGIDESGGGDDLLAGETVAVVSSTR